LENGTVVRQSLAWKYRNVRVANNQNPSAIQTEAAIHAANAAASPDSSSSDSSSSSSSSSDSEDEAPAKAPPAPVRHEPAIHPIQKIRADHKAPTPKVKAPKPAAATPAPAPAAAAVTPAKKEKKRKQKDEAPASAVVTPAAGSEKKVRCQIACMPSNMFFAIADWVEEEEDEGVDVFLEILDLGI
jgi:hypothetical protein